MGCHLQSSFFTLLFCLHGKGEGPGFGFLSGFFAEEGMAAVLDLRVMVKALAIVILIPLAQVFQQSVWYH